MTETTADVLVQDLYYAYPPPAKEAIATPVLRAVSFEVKHGESVVLLGRVGAGKTTLCMALNGLVPHATGGVFRGLVKVLGLDTREHAVADMARSVGLVFQHPENQLTQMRVDDEVAFGLENLGVPLDEMAERVAWALDAVGLGRYHDRSPLLLSGGEKQRLAIAAMLAMRPQVLVLDEPTASLDPAGKASVFKVLQELRRKHNVSIVMATQELERVPRFADRVLVLHEGVIARTGSPREVFDCVPRMREYGIGAPQMAELGYLLGRREGRKYRFLHSSEAYKELRHRALKVKLIGVRPTSAPQQSTSPFAGHDQVLVEDLAYRYQEGTEALRGVSLQLHPGEFVALLGPNGAGKTTLARHLNGLLRPQQGRVLVEKMDTRQASVAQLAQYVGYVFQDPDRQIFSATVEEEVAFGVRMLQLPPAIIARRVQEALDRFGLAAHAATPPALLGYAQRRQVALASILCMQPRLLILDEPTGGLDWQSQQELMQVIVSLNQAGRTIVLITHDMRVVAEYTRRAIVLLDGRIHYDGDTRELFKQRELLAHAQLMRPPICRLAERLSPQGIPPEVLSTREFVNAWMERLPARNKRKRRKAQEAEVAVADEC